MTEREREREGEMGSKAAVADKPHVVCIPCPAQSHIKAMLKLAKLLHHEGFHITFVNTEFNHNRFLKSTGSSSLDGLPNFQFETIPVGYQDINIVATFEPIRKDFLEPFRDLLAKLNDTDSSKAPPVTFILSDAFMTFTFTAAEEVGIPVIFFFSIAACCLMVFKQYRILEEKGLTPPKDISYLSNGYLGPNIDCIPGMKNIHLRDLPSNLRITDPNDILLDFCIEGVEMAIKASAIVIHTFDALERDVLDALSSIYPRVYAIGPFQLLLNQIPIDSLKSIDCNAWKEETECLQWLDSKEPNSVIYVNFGSVIVLKQEELVEFGMGLANSNHHFLWIIRPDLVIGDSATLPPEFAVKAEEKGLIAGWCPQEKVLNHSSVGGFLTHCGWNSITESLSAGVPMLCWPFFGDQQINCRYTCTEWGVGMEIDYDVKRDGVEKLVRELLEGEKGKEMKNKVMQWKKLAEEATGPRGSSSINLKKLVNEVFPKTRCDLVLLQTTSYCISISMLCFKLKYDFQLQNFNS